MPQVYRDQDSGLQYVMTDGGHNVVVGEDKAGRVYFVDSNGNFYYDTGIPSLGFYMVSLQAGFRPRHEWICVYPHACVPGLERPALRVHL